MNTDDNALDKCIHAGTSGIRDDDVYQHIDELIGNTNGPCKLRMAPRGSYKNPFWPGRVCREITLDPSTNILDGMEPGAHAVDEARRIRDILSSTVKSLLSKGAAEVHDAVDNP